jgi:hypothetical protein
MTSQTGAPEVSAGGPNPIDSTSPPALPQAPRPITVRARRRSWAELSVRVWVILTLAAFLITLYFIITRTQEALNDRYLIEHGVDTKVKILSVDGDPVMKRHPRYQTSRVRISFPWHGETLTREIEMDAVANESKPNAFLVTTSEITLRIDPNNPDRWTEETVAKSWAQELTAVGLLLPILLVVAIVTVIQRRIVLGTWSEGTLQRAVVVDTRHSAIAPASRIVRYTLESNASGEAAATGRIWQTLMPVSAGIPRPGELLWVIVSPTNSSRAIVAKLYG